MCDETWRSPLHVAVAAGHRDTMQVLVNHTWAADSLSEHLQVSAAAAQVTPAVHASLPAMRAEDRILDRMTAHASTDPCSRAQVRWSILEVICDGPLPSRVRGPLERSTETDCAAGTASETD